MHEPATSDHSGAISEPVVLLERERWLVVNKPAGWHSVEHADADPPRTEPASERAPEIGSVEAWLRQRRPELASLSEAGLVHRLDRSTSGCLLVARSERAQARLRDAISEPGGEIRKRYLALVDATVPAQGSFALHFSSRHKRSAKVTVSDRGEPRTQGRCRWRSLGTVVQSEAATRGVTMLEVELIGPGRRHQIRAGLAHQGSPLVGDALYHGNDPLPGLGGPALHAWRLELEGEVVEAPLPEAWRHFQRLLSRRTDGSSTTNPMSKG